MTYSRREEIFSKEYLSIEDIEELLEVKYDKAADIMRQIKSELRINPKYNGQGVRLDIQGKLHVQDYLDYFQISTPERYLPRQRVIIEEQRAVVWRESH